jgi:hypothetical protein
MVLDVTGKLKIANLNGEICDNRRSQGTYPPKVLSGFLGRQRVHIPDLST